MNILQTRYIVFFAVMLIVPAGVSYLAGREQNIDYLFFMRAVSIAFFITVFYYLMVKNNTDKKSQK
jgi:intracellular septation protein A